MAEHPQFHIVNTKQNVSVPLLFLRKWLATLTSPLSAAHCTPGCPGGFTAGWQKGLLLPPSPPCPAPVREALATCANLSQGCVWNIYTPLLLSYYLAV